VQQVWQWYGSGESLKQIRQRLITGGVKQKGKSSRRQHVWSYQVSVTFSSKTCTTFDFKRTIIQGLVTKIDALPDKTMTVKLEISDDSSEDLSIGKVLSNREAIY